MKKPDTGLRPDFQHNNSRLDWAAACLLFAATLLFFFPVLFDDQSILIGDAIFHGIPMLHYLREVIHGRYDMLWTDLIYGGHPIFAESQGGFLSPLNLVIAWLFEPVTGVDVYHALCTFLCGLGVYFLCRDLGCRFSSALFGAVAMTTSTMWLTLQGNLTISNALMCVPWVMLAFEHFLRSPRAGTTIVLALTVTYLVMAGYPHLLQACAVFLFMSMLPSVTHWYQQGVWRQHIRPLLFPACCVVVIALGLGAVQLLPMFELAKESYRANGIEITQFPGMVFLRGLLFTDIEPEPMTPNFTLTGSLAVAMLFLSGMVGARAPRALGMIVATLFLCYLGAGYVSPGFEFIHRHGLIPGIRFFRLTTPYFYVAVVGICVIAALGVESWARAGEPRRYKLLLIGAGVLPTLLAATWLHTPQVSWWHYLGMGLFAGFGTAACLLRWERALPAILLAALIAEVCVLRVGEIHYASASLIARPDTLEHTCFAQPGCNAKTVDLSGNTVFVGFSHARSVETPKRIPAALDSLAPMTNMLWDVPSTGGAMALQLRRTKLATDFVEQEILHGSSRAPGDRLMDVIDLRYVGFGFGNPFPALGAGLLEPAPSSPLRENPFARGKYQIYDAAMFVDSADEALMEFRKPGLGPVPTIVIEGAAGHGNEVEQVLPGTENHQIRVESESAADIRLDVKTNRAGWLFVADSYHPGWHATVNGEVRTIYPAQVMGKALRIDAGSSRVVLQFAPVSYSLGRAISVATMLLLLVVLGFLAKSFMTRKVRR